MDVSTAKPHGEPAARDAPRTAVLKQESASAECKSNGTSGCETVSQKLGYPGIVIMAESGDIFLAKPLRPRLLNPVLHQRVNSLDAASRSASGAPRMPQTCADVSRRHAPSDRWRAGISRSPFRFQDGLHRRAQSRPIVNSMPFYRCQQGARRRCQQSGARIYPFSRALCKTTRIFKRLLDRHMFFEIHFSNHAHTCPFSNDVAQSMTAHFNVPTTWTSSCYSADYSSRML